MIRVGECLSYLRAFRVRGGQTGLGTLQSPTRQLLIRILERSGFSERIQQERWLGGNELDRRCELFTPPRRHLAVHTSTVTSVARTPPQLLHSKAHLQGDGGGGSSALRSGRPWNHTLADTMTKVENAPRIPSMMMLGGDKDVSEEEIDDVHYQMMMWNSFAAAWDDIVADLRQVCACDCRGGATF